MADITSEDGTDSSRVLLHADYDPGEFVFDYFNQSQLLDLAQSLGFDPMVSRQVSREKSSSSEGKATIKVFEIGRRSEHGVAESATHVGALANAIMIMILSRLMRQNRLWAVSTPSVDSIARTLETATRSYGWLIIGGFWRVETDPPSLRLIKMSAESANIEDQLLVKIDIPVKSPALTGSGSLRLTGGRDIRADVFAQTENWDSESGQFLGIGHAVFARMGDPRFHWHSVYDPGGGGAQSDW
jgi:hypothetical protein